MRTTRPPSSSRRGRRALVVLVLAWVAVACGAQGETGTAPATDPTARRTRAATDPDAPIALVATDAGLAGVPVGTSVPRWVVPGAVAAPDGSAVFGLRAVPGPEGDGFEVFRIDPRTGAEELAGRHVPGPAGIHVAAVEPGGALVALAAPVDGGTLVLDFDPQRGGARSKPVFEGQVEPEAFSLDRTRVFAARIYADRYHVHVLDLATGEQHPTSGPDKLKPPEDMDGAVVQAVLSPDGAHLATLYRDSASPDHTAFVHLLSLGSGTTVCIDLHAPFGTGAPGTDAIEWRDDGIVAVGHRATDPRPSVTATFDPAAILTGPPQEHYHADARPDAAPPAVPDGVADTPGFRRFVVLAP